MKTHTLEEICLFYGVTPAEVRRQPSAFARAEANSRMVVEALRKFDGNPEDATISDVMRLLPAPE